ncbi:MAG: lipid-A-disaccharide synthase N-terminal domain-containing protein [Planctomycetota bacterium]
MDPQFLAGSSLLALEWSFNLLGNPDLQVVITPWKIYGLIGVALFTGRWLVQMYYSRKAGQPVTPRIFWLMSMAGSVMLLTYFIFSPKHRDMVGILSNLFPCFIAAYNLYLDLKHATRTQVAAAAEAAKRSARQATVPEPAVLNK